MMSVLVVLFVICATLVFFWVKKHYTFWTRNGVKQLDANIIFGSLYENCIQRKSFQDIIKEHYDIFKAERYYGMYQLHQPVLVIRDPELIKTITVKEFESFTDHANHAREDVDLFWSKNLFALMGDKWHNMRATLSRAFTGSKMRMMYPLIIDCAERFTSYFENKTEDVITLEMKDTFTRATNDVIASCAFGLQCDSLKDRNNQFYLTGREGFDFTGFIRKMIFFTFSACPKLLKLFGMKIFTKKMSTYFRAVINETINMRRDNDIVRQDMIHLLLQAQKGMLQATEEVDTNESFAVAEDYSVKKTPKASTPISDYDIAAQAAVFFLGGFDTTSYLMSFTAYELAVHPDIQARLVREIDEVLGSKKVTYDALQKMKYLDMIVSESLRKWPIIAITDRVCNKEFVIEPVNDGEQRVVIRKGMIIWFPVFGIHRDSNIYENSERFDPERFNMKNKTRLNQTTYMPFGGGPRSCIGSRFALLATKAFLVQLLRKIEFVPIQETPIPIVIARDNFNTFVEGGLKIGFKRRRN